MNKRASGILLHITSLPSEYGIGDMGPGAYRFADFLSDSGQSYWQILPLNPTSMAYGNSPYSSHSVFAGNTLFISPVLLKEDGFIYDHQLSGIGTSDSGTDSVDYFEATNIKRQILDTAYENYKDRMNSVTEDNFDQFCSDNSYWLDDYSLFMVLKDEFNQNPWNKWPKDYRDRYIATLSTARKSFNERIEKIKFFQFLFYGQWHRLKGYCNRNNIQIIGDLPIYPNFDSSDVWTRRELFKLGEKGEKIFSAGVPPDYFSDKGQLWGNPVYNWDEIKKTGYEWWIKRFRHNFSLTDIVRVDHFRGFVAYWEVPSDHKTAIDGKWVKVPVYEFFETLNRSFNFLPVIAEDLGTITPDVKEVMNRFGFPGMKLLIFAFGDDFPDGDYLPHNHIRNCVVYTGTHDNNTVRGWFREEADHRQIYRLSRYTDTEINEENVSRVMARMAMGSVADTAIIPMQDILSLSEKSRMNLPSRSGENWHWRLNTGQISTDVKNYLREITEVYGRI